MEREEVVMVVVGAEAEVEDMGAKVVLLLQSKGLTVMILKNKFQIQILQ